MANIIDDTLDFTFYLKETDSLTKIKKASDYIDLVKQKFRLKKTAQIYLPWYKTVDNFAFRPGEVTLWSGQNGHGKSLLTSQIALSLMGQNQKVCIASFEMKPATTLQRMGRMWLGINPYEISDDLKKLDDLHDQFGEWTDDKLWLYDQIGTANQEIVIGMVRYCAKELKIQHVFIDNLAKCVKNEDDFNGQKSFIDELTSVARDYQIHIHVVHHLRKPSNENAVPDKHDNKGSGSITDQVDNVMMVFRNKAKEDDIKNNGKFAKTLEDPDQYLLCRKQRNFEGSGEGEPSIKLWFHRDSQQYLGESGEQPMFFCNWPHVAS